MSKAWQTVPVPPLVVRLSEFSSHAEGHRNWCFFAFVSLLFVSTSPICIYARKQAEYAGKRRSFSLVIGIGWNGWRFLGFFLVMAMEWMDDTNFSTYGE